MASLNQTQPNDIGKTLGQVDTPAVVLDLAKLEVNCGRMLELADRLHLSWRAHIKTHKTTQLTRLQVGDQASTPVNLAVSTVLEAENISPLLSEYKAKGRQVNCLYAFPLHKGAVGRLATVAGKLGQNGLSVMIDHIDQVPLAAEISTLAGVPPLAFIKLDVGYGRAGVVLGSSQLDGLVHALLKAQESKQVVFDGIYCHAGGSYAARKDTETYEYLRGELESLAEAAAFVHSIKPDHALILSLGATPTATSLQNADIVQQYNTLVDEKAGSGGNSHTYNLATQIHRLQANSNLRVELHAGVYPTLDLQQLATRARGHHLLSHDDIAISLLADVASVYPGRGPSGTDEALIAAGSLALGREPCANQGADHYAGWGYVMSWNTSNPPPPEDFPATHGGWQVGRISQEHGVLSWKGDAQEASRVPLKVGQRIRVWPNHACIAGAGFPYYLVVDSRKGDGDEIVDVWQRWSGW